jgi:hypothetical protein
LKKDGTVVAWGGPLNLWGQTNTPPGLNNVTAIAAAGGQSFVIREDEPPVWRALLHQPQLKPEGFNVSLRTRSGRVYSLEFKSRLDDELWTALPLVAGNGGIRTFVDPTATTPQRFYRVRQW